MLRCFAALVVLSVTFLSRGAAQYPFPQNRGSEYKGIYATSANSSAVQSAYASWKNSYYTENGSYARIKFDDPRYTVSEGIGYGMLIMVYMDNSTNNTRDEFDKLWNYYRHWPNSHGLMHWKINGFSNVAEQNAATDAELDVAIALLMAYKQWGDSKYLDDAKGLVSKIYQYEVNANKYLKPGDSWDDKKNPSYFSTAAMEVFKEVDGNDWQTVINNSYSLLKACRNNSTGLVPDWCSEGGGALGDFRYDAVRCPWRMAWAHAWFGHSDAQDIAGKMAAWASSATGGDPSAMKDGYALNGNAVSNWGNAVFTGAFSCAGMVNSTHQNWVNTGFSATNSAWSDGYYVKSMQVVLLLLLSGNWPNLWNTSVVSVDDIRLPGSNTDRPKAFFFRNAGELTLSVHVPLSGAHRTNICVFDLAGREIASTVLYGTGLHTVSLGRHINPGVHVLSAENDDQVFYSFIEEEL